MSTFPKHSIYIDGGQYSLWQVWWLQYRRGDSMVVPAVCIILSTSSGHMILHDHDIYRHFLNDKKQTALVHY